MRLVPIECVPEGSFLAKTIYDNEGRVLLRKGVPLSPVLTRRIKILNILSIYIQDEYSEGIIEDIIKPELRQTAVKTIKDTFYSLEKYNKSINTVNPSSTKDINAIKQRDAYFQSIGDIARDIIQELLDKKHVLINMVDIKSLDNYTYQHSVNVAVLSLVLGMQLQLDKNKLFDLCMGALLHDIGRVLIPKEIFLKEGPLSLEEYEAVKQHTSKGYEYLRTTMDVSSTSRIVVLQHHERFDGDGYPEKRGSENISLLSRIVAIADVYDALTSDRPFRKALCPSEAMEYIMACGGRQFDYSLVKIFSSVVILYPEGTLIKLSNGDIAVVIGSLANYPLRPTVKILKSRNPAVVGTEINLMQKLDIVIDGLVHSL